MAVIPNVVLGTIIDPATFGNPVVNETNQQSERMAVFVSKSVGQSIPNGVNTALTWNTETIDTAALHDNVTNNTRITIPVGGDGLWHFGYSVSFDATTGGSNREASMRKNAVAVPLWGYSGAFLSAAGFYGAAGSGILRMAAGDFLECFAYHTAGGALNVRGDASANLLSNFWGFRLGD